ncbi:MAG: hypothetical protein KatS3mg005_2041 [Bryobacteraceae bacterium]|nr:MAG: hypothetical protein KatS3mg005_2041 [Bryobacteraceae bacterium]
MWAAAAVDLSLPPGVFWDLTLEEFVALWERHEARETLANYRAGVIASLLFNVHRGPKQRPVSWREFFPDGRQAQRRLTPAEVVARMDAWKQAVEEGHGKLG